MKYTQEQIDEAKRVVAEHGFRVKEINEAAETDKPSQEQIDEAIKVVESYGLKVVKESEEQPAQEQPAQVVKEDAAEDAVAAAAEVPAETPAETPAEDDGELITIQVTKAELEAIKSIVDKVEYEDDGTADAEQTGAVIDALDNENVYGAYPEE